MSLPEEENITPVLFNIHPNGVPCWSAEAVEYIPACSPCEVVNYSQYLIHNLDILKIS